MITRSPPSRSVQPATHPQPRSSLTAKSEVGSTSNSSRNGTSNGTHTSSGNNTLRKSLTNATALPSSTSRRPEDAQSDYWLKQMAASLSERDKARAQATAIEDAKNTEIYELRQQFADERRQWKQTCDVVSTHDSFKRML